MDHSPENVLTTRRTGRVLVITMTRSAKRNAVDRQLADALDAALNQLEDDPDLWAGVLTGSGGCFCAGSDLTANGDYVTERGGEYGVIRRARRKPLIAAVEGPALGGGLEIALACDLVIASTTASFGLPETARGLVATCGGLFRGPRALPLNLVREMVLTGEPIGAERAYQVGFVNSVTAEGATEAVAIELCERICRNGPVAVQASLVALNSAIAASDELGWRLTEAAIETITAADDTREGVLAFLEKRSPRWTGR